MGNMVRVKVAIQGTRTLLQHAFGPDAIPLEKVEKTGVAGNDPEEWKRTCMLLGDGQLFIPSTYIFSCLKNGAIHTKRGRGSIQSAVVSTLQVEEDVIPLTNRFVSSEKDLHTQMVLTPPDEREEVFIYVASVRNPTTKGRNVRYRLAARLGWRCKFTLCWDKTIVTREQMKAVLRDAGMLGGLGDGIRIGCGRFEVLTYKELGEEPAGTVAEVMPETNGRTKMSASR